METIKLLKEHGKSLSVLYVEDEDLIRENILDFLRLIFSTVDEAKDGEEGLEKFKTSKREVGAYYDIIISDINMPNMDGIQMCKEIQMLNPEQSIVIMSAYNDTARLLKLINMNVNYFLMKPVPHEDIVNVLYKISKILTDKQLLEHYYKETELLSNELAEKNLQLETTIRYYKEEIIRLEKQSSQSTPVSAELEEVKEMKIDKSLENDLRFTQNDKMDAESFIATLDDSVMDKVEGFMHELDRLALLVYDIEEADREQTVEKMNEIVEIFTTFTNIIDTLVTFPVTVRAFQSFSDVIAGLDPDFGGEISKRKLFTTVLLGVLKDLEAWINSIFIDRTTDDIHYFDASFANNCFEIEAMFNESAIETDDDDLEFF